MRRRRRGRGHSCGDAAMRRRRATGGEARRRTERDAKQRVALRGEDPEDDGGDGLDAHLLRAE
eukprot:4728955-Prymnesium_polylepis.1